MKRKCVRDLENCGICKTDLKVKGEWEVFWGVSLKDFLGGVMWKEVAVVVLIPVALFLLWGWWSIVADIIFFWFFSSVAGTWGVMVWSPSEEDEPEIINKCSAGVEGCRICNNEYSHEFNYKYEKGLKWYQKW